MTLVTPAQTDAPPFHPLELEAAELQLALDASSGSDQPARLRMTKAIAAIGGELLFEIEMEHGDAPGWFAAVAFDTGAERRVAIVSLPLGGSAPSFEPAESSAFPMARIAGAYDGLLTHLRAAA